MKGSNVRVAVVQAAAVPFDAEACVDKAVKLIGEAAATGARVLVFPEAFITGYPKGMNYGLSVGTRDEVGREEFRLYLEQAIEVPGPHTQRLGEAAAAADVHVVIGAIEREGATVYCTALFFGPDGALLGKHRKLMPTSMERVMWGCGDGSTLTAVDTPYGKLGAVICWENYMPLARTALYQKGVQLYLAPTADQRDEYQCTLRHIAIEGRCFVIACNQYVERSMYPKDLNGYKELESQPDVMCRGGSCVINPFGQYVAGPSFGGEEILLSDLDLDEIARGKADLDVVGHYARPDIFELVLHERESN